MNTEEIVTEVDLQIEDSGFMRVFRVVDLDGHEVYGPVEDARLCEKFIEKERGNDAR